MPISHGLKEFAKLKAIKQLNMSPEKTPAIYMTKIPLDEEDPKKKKICSKTLWSCILAAILIGLCVALTIELLDPFDSKYKDDGVGEVHVYKGKIGFITRNRNNLFEDEKAPWHLDFLINPTRLCETVNPPDSEAYIKDPEVKLLMLVPSTTSHFEQRKAIRRTWGSVAQEPHSPLRLGFVLGTTSNTTENELIDQESVAYGDIIQADFEDNYRNLTTKSVLMLKWVSQHCAHAQYFLKADDDTFVNLHVIAQMLQKDPYTSANNFIGGFIHTGAQPYRGPDEKFQVSEEDFPGTEYPPYASGSAYVSTGNTCSQLFEASKKSNPFLPLEDIFVTGLLADDIGASLFHEPNFLFKDPPKPISWDSYKSVATAHSVTPDDIDQIWSEMTKSIFDNLRLMNFDSFLDFPNKDFSLDDDSLSELLVFPGRNTGGFFESSDSDIFSRILNPSDKLFLSSSSQSSSSSIDSQPDSKPASSSSSSSSGILKIPMTDIFNVTFFLRK